MAFLGRLNSLGNLVDCEIFNGSRSKIQANSLTSTYPEENAKESPKQLQTKYSRTFVKPYDRAENSVLAMGSPSTVRYVPSSVSSNDNNSMTETDTSTLRCCSTLSMGTVETESETLCLIPHIDNSSENSEEESVPVQEPELDKDSITSVCSWEEAMSMGISQVDNQSFLVPSLNLQSESTSLSYHQQMEELKLERQAGEAYENWLSGKRRLGQYKHRIELEQQEQEKQKAALRQQEAAQCYQEWCKRKSQQTKSEMHLRQIDNGKGNCSPPSQRIQQANRTHLYSWELRKLKQAKERRQQQERKALRQEQEKLQRRQQSNQAFQRWMANVSQRPKPVPLNQGLKSLRGTISDIYINPNTWVK